MERDPGLEEAVRAMGGIGALARGLGITQPSVSTWRHIPAARVLEVEALTGISRTVLRPDLYARAGQPRRGGRRRRGGALDRVRAARVAAAARAGRRSPGAALPAAGRPGDAARPGAHRAGAGGGRRVRRGGEARVLRPLPRGRPRRARALRVLLPDRLPERAAARPPARRHAAPRPRARRRPLRPRGPPRHALRDHERLRRRPLRGFGRRRRTASSPGTSRPGRDASSPIWKRRSPRGSTGRSARVGRVFIDIETEGFAMETRRSA